MGALLFDLDGTFVDTAPDMIGAVNRLRAESDLTPLPFARLRPWVSHGAMALVREGMPEADDAQRERWRQRFLDLYAEHVYVDSVLFPGVDALLTGVLAQRPWGIVTNKPGWLTRPLLAAMELQPGAMLSGDCLPRRKPHPDTLLEACRRLEVKPEACIYVGDAERDIAAGRAAGMRTVACTFGYIPDHEDPATWQADAMIQHMDELAPLLAQWGFHPE